jgi:hypothetical protein
MYRSRIAHDGRRADPLEARTHDAIHHARRTGVPRP